MKVKDEGEKADLNIKKKWRSWHPVPSWQINGETIETVTNVISWAPKSLQIVMKLPWNWKTLAPWKKNYDQPRQHIKKQRHYFANKGLSSHSYGFSIVVYGCESWTIKKPEHRRIDAFELRCWRRLVKSALDCRKIKPVHPKWNESWISIARTDAEADTPILGHLMCRAVSLEKNPDARKDWKQEKGTTEDKIVGWHHQFNGHEFEQVLEDDKGQGYLACCSPWGHK